MCGIFAILQKNALSITAIEYAFNATSKRGPDKHILKQMAKNLTFGFHRLSIVDRSFRGDQPFYHPNKQISLICNGEIYNFEKLKESYQIDNYISSSDCEIIAHLYEKIGIKRTLQELDSEAFAMCIYDGEYNRLIVARDRFGVRPLFTSNTSDGNILFASEMKSIVGITDGTIEQFPPSTYRIYDMDTMELIEESLYYDKPYKQMPALDVLRPQPDLDHIKKLFISAVQKRLMSDRPLGFLLSGGLDSSLVCSIASRIMKNLRGEQISTFAIGLKGSTDLEFARKVAEHINSNHHEVELSEKTFLDAIPEVIRAIESYDTTTVRASVGNYLIGKYIKETTDIAVIFNGDGSDEQSGYRYLANAPNAQAFHDDCCRLLDEIHYFDVLRSDRSMSSEWSLETRAPFLDTDFVDYYMSIDPRTKMYHANENQIEKYLLRAAFNTEELLPSEVLWRSKEAFSDGCSSLERSWHVIIKEHIDLVVSDSEFSQAESLYTNNTPLTKEAFYYRQIFEGTYSGHSNVIPHFWMPRWNNGVNDPSARELPAYAK